MLFLARKYIMNLHAPEAVSGTVEDALAMKEEANNIFRSDPS